MSCLHLEGAVIGPEIDRIGDVGASPFVYLKNPCQLRNRRSTDQHLTHHLGRLRASNVELHVSILFPVAK
jgi:hypothetical protein